MKQSRKILLVASLSLIPLVAGFIMGYKAWTLATPFNPKTYNDLLRNLRDEGYTFLLPRDYHNQSGKIAIIIHDADMNTQGVATFIRVENEYGIKSCFYLRPDAEYFTKTIQPFQQLETQGWEIGFHYDCWSRTYPDKAEAQQLFQAQLALLRTFYNVSTTHAHGDEYNFNVNNAELYNASLWHSMSLLTDTSTFKGFTEISDSNHQLSDAWALTDRMLILLHTDWW